MDAARAKEAIERTYGEDADEAGRRMGVSRQQVYKYMSGSSAIGGMPLERLCFDSSSSPPHLYGRSKEEVIDYLARTIEREIDIPADWIAAIARMSADQRSRMFPHRSVVSTTATPREPFEEDQQQAVSEPSGAGTPKKRRKRGASRRKPG